MSRRLAVVVALVAVAAVALTLVVRALPLRDRALSDTDARSSHPAAATPALQGRVKRYVAVGDSFTSGPLIPYVDAEQTSCLRSSANYPAVLGGWVRARQVVDVSCSGADTADLLGGASGAGARGLPQLAAVTSSTDLVTVGIGGNDFGIFGSLVARCPAVAAGDPDGAPCRASFTRPDGTDVLLARMPRVERRVLAVLAVVAKRAPDAAVAVVGYPRMVPAVGTCPELPFAAGDYRWADRVERALNTALAGAARRSGAVFVDTYAASRGHDACAGAAAWVNGQGTVDIRALAYHPYLEGMLGSASAAYAALTGHAPTASMRARAERAATVRPPGSLTLGAQRVLAALLGGR